MALSPRDLAEARALFDRVQHGSVAREDWANLAAIILIAQGDLLCSAIAADGLDAFIQVSAAVYEGHAFHHDDYRRIYDRVCAHVLPQAS